jgi:hypothetical protein
MDRLVALVVLGRLAFTSVSVAAVTGAADVAPRSSVSNRVLIAHPGTTLGFDVGDRASALEVTRDGMHGEGIELRRFPGRLRGYVGSAAVALVIAPPRITGLVGNQTISLDVLPAAKGLLVAGHFGLREVALEARADRITGSVGPCRYDLPLKDGEYRGVVGCGAEPVPVRLSLPVAFVARGDTELLAMLVALLAR